MKYYFTLLLFLGSQDAIAQFDTSAPISKKAIGVVTEINKGSSSGSGFLVALGHKRLLVTNKHMIGSWSPVDSLIYIDSISITLYSKKRSEENSIRVGIQISKLGKPIPLKVRVHPNPKIDIAVIDITDDVVNLPIENTGFVDTSLFLKLDKAKDVLSYGSQVFTIGYPGGIKVFKTNQPLVKSGYIASSLDGNLVMEQSWVNRKGQTIKTLTDGKIFIVDGLIIPGNSGGPVLMSQEVVWFKIGGQLKVMDNPQNYFIGIVSSIYTNTGLSTIFSADNILEVIQKFK